MTNKLLIVVIIILLPIAIFIKNNEELLNDNNIVKQKEQAVIVNLKTSDEIIKLSLNDYLIGVVGQEMPASFHIEALKAQAIAARTFAYNYLNNNEINISTTVQSYIDNSQMKEKWRSDYDKYYKKVKQAVEDTDNLVIKYQDKIIKSYYFAISNGMTEDVKQVFSEDLPYLTPVDSKFDESVKNFEVTTSFTYENFCKLLSINPCEVNISNIKKDKSNRVEEITINNKTYSGIDIRKILSLRSTDFTINKLNNSIEIITKGYGHGVGMSQYGANYLANNNKNYIDILKYYYKDIEIKNY